MRTHPWRRWLAALATLALVFALAPVTPGAAQGTDKTKTLLPLIESGSAPATELPEPMNNGNDAGPEAVHPQPVDTEDGLPLNWEEVAAEAPVAGQQGAGQAPEIAGPVDGVIDAEPPVGSVEIAEPEPAAEPDDLLEEEASIPPDASAVFDDPNDFTLAGRLGVGTDTPGNKVQISTNNNNTQGIIFANSHTGVNAGVRIRMTTSGPARGVELRKYGQNSPQTWSHIVLADWSRLRTEPQANGLIITTGGADPLVFGTSNAERMRLTPAGRVGIGTTTPLSRLDVAGGDIQALSATTITGTTAAIVRNHATTGTRWGLYSEINSPGGYAGYFRSNAVTGSSYAVVAYTWSPGGVGVLGSHSSLDGVNPGVYGVTHSTEDYARAILGVVVQSAPGPGSTAVRGINNGTGPFGVGVWGSQAGSGWGVHGQVLGTGRGVFGEATNSSGVSFAGYFFNHSNDGVGAYIEGRGQGRSEAALRVHNSRTSQGMAGFFTVNSDFPTAHISNVGAGQVLYLTNGAGIPSGASGGNFIEARDETETDLQFRVTTDGEVRSDVGFATPASDYADMMAVAGDPADYEPGDVLVLAGDSRLGRSVEPNSTAVVGVYSTKPGVVGGDVVGAWEGDVLTQGEREMLATQYGNRVPVAMAGIVPVKVTAENGPILPGDLLVTSSTPGYAMKATEYSPGAIFGKAMTSLHEGEGVIEMLVMMR